MAAFCASGAHVPKSTLRSGSRNPSFSTRPDLNLRPAQAERSQDKFHHRQETEMVAQKGKDLLLKIDNAGSFVTVAGLRSKRIAFNSETVDITDADSAGRWRELLAGAGVQRAAVSGSGIFKDAAS